MATMIVIACPMCMQKIRAPETVIGRQIRCPQCKNSFNAADPNAVPTDAPGVQSRLTEAPSAESPNWDNGEPEVPVVPRAASGSAFVDYLLFHRMVTPRIITGLFYLGAAVILLIGLVYGILGILAIVASKQTAMIGLLSLLIAVFTTIVSLVMWRIFCEVLISLFRILDNVREINLQLKTKGPI